MEPTRQRSQPDLLDVGNEVRRQNTCELIDTGLVGFLDVSKGTLRWPTSLISARSRRALSTFETHAFHSTTTLNANLLPILVRGIGDHSQSINEALEDLLGSIALLGCRGEDDIPERFGGVPVWWRCLSTKVARTE